VNNDDDLVSLSRQGFWIGPDESKEQFLKRVKLTQESLKGSATSCRLLQSRIDHITDAKYDFIMKDIPWTFDNTGLSMWEGAALWIEDHSGISVPHVQLKTGFKKGKWLFYSIDEVVSHELFHAARVAYNEPKYEEILAYTSSNNFVRKTLGPIFQSPKESLFFVCLLFFCLFLDIVLSIFYSFFSIFYSIPCLYLAYLSLRLYRKHRRIRTIKRTMRKLVESDKELNGIICRLTDKEIEDFAHYTDCQIMDYFLQNKDKHLRIENIFSLYLEAKNS